MGRLGIEVVNCKFKRADTNYFFLIIVQNFWPSKKCYYDVYNGFPLNNPAWIETESKARQIEKPRKENSAKE